MPPVSAYAIRTPLTLMNAGSSCRALTAVVVIVTTPSQLMSSDIRLAKVAQWRHR